MRIRIISITGFFFTLSTRIYFFLLSTDHTSADKETLIADGESDAILPASITLKRSDLETPKVDDLVLESVAMIAPEGNVGHSEPKRDTEDPSRGEEFLTSSPNLEASCDFLLLGWLGLGFSVFVSWSSLSQAFWYS